MKTAIYGGSANQKTRIFGIKIYGTCYNRLLMAYERDGKQPVCLLKQKFSGYYIIAGDPLYIFKLSTIALNKGYLNPDSSIDYWYSTSTWCYFRYLFVDVKHTWLLSYLAVAGVIVWIKQEFKERLIDNETTYVVIWGVGLICLFSFAIIHTNSLILIPKETQYMTMFLAPFSLLAGFSLSKLKGAFLCVVFSILIFGSFVLCGLEQQAVHVFTSNSKAALVFAQNNNEYPVYGTYHAVRASNYMSFFQNDAPRIKPISEIAQAFTNLEKDNNQIHSLKLPAYVILDFETIHHHGQNPKINAQTIPESWEKIERLQPIGFGLGEKILSILINVIDWLPADAAKKIHSYVDPYFRPKPAYVYRIPTACKFQFIFGLPIEMAEREILESKKTIEKKIGRPVTSFAYPFGKKAQYSSDLFPVLEKLGFKFAVTTETGVNTQSTPLFELNRGIPWEIGMIK